MTADELRRKAASLRANGFSQQALEIYLFLCDGDPSFDTGGDAVRVAECYETLGRMTEARYWAARAAEQGPSLPDRKALGERLGAIALDQVDGSPPSSVWGSGGDEAAYAETQAIIEAIPGGEALVKWMGGEVNFHDAEVVVLELNRESESRLVLSPAGAGDSTRVTFYLSDWIDVNLSGFSNQNVICDLLLRQAANRKYEVWELGVGVSSRGSRDCAGADLWRQRYHPRQHCADGGRAGVGRMMGGQMETEELDEFGSATAWQAGGAGCGKRAGGAAR